ncbi:hypothetical protein Ae201684P_004546 [Aphanomyces euteiches]|nr:hypothetical protein Ae201684P_004546 [Aphanomyces euteiches]
MGSHSSKRLNSPDFTTRPCRISHGKYVAFSILSAKCAIRRSLVFVDIGEQSFCVFCQAMARSGWYAMNGWVLPKLAERECKDTNRHG